MSRRLPDYIWVLVVTAIWVTKSAVHYTGVNICWAKRVGFIEQWDYGEQNCSDVLCWIPSFAGQLAALWIIDGWMQDRNAQIAILIDVRVPDFCDESNGWRRIRIVVWELHERLKQDSTTFFTTMRQRQRFVYFRIDFSSQARFPFWKKIFSLQAVFSRCRCEASLELFPNAIILRTQRTKTRSQSVPRA